MNNPRATDVHTPWKPHEIMAVLNRIPDGKKPPAAFIYYLRTTMRVYHADSQDLWETIQQIITPAENTKFLVALERPTYEAWANVVMDDSAREEAVLTALAKKIQKPSDFKRILEIKLEKGEGADEFLDRFSKLYMDQSDDLDYQNGASSPQYCAILLNCLPTKIADLIKTDNRNWSENRASQMARAVMHYWKEGRNQEHYPVTIRESERKAKKELATSNSEPWFPRVPANYGLGEIKVPDFSDYYHNYTPNFHSNGTKG
ncbi:uncharacterized protein LOC116973492 [Amblyraja radiata]|uniref:uncharacterized protein LOC116973492 n=1 Tax=Amblyraja radiata TaxID=386614 RepID=UPI0014040FAB|nr:uncharacterized protein LOC116973492 [Amblyraja radiata]